MKNRREREELQEAVDFFDSSIFCTESFETMSTKNAIMAIVLYCFSTLFLLALVYFSPQILYTTESKIETQKRTKEVGLQIKLTDLKNFHKAVKLGLKTGTSSRRSISVIVTGTIKLKRYGQVVREFNLESSVFLLSSSKYDFIFNSGNYKIDEIIANVNVYSSDSYFNELFYEWVFENSSWTFFSLLIRSCVCLIIILVIISFSRALPFGEFEPTFMESFTKRFSLLFILAFAPIPELLQFFEIQKLDAILEYYDFISSHLLIAYMIISAWDLSVRNSDKEERFIEKVVLSFIVIMCVLTIPRLIKLNNENIQEFFENWLPLFVLLGISFSLTFVPDKIKSANPEFRCSYLHMFLILPPVLANVFLNGNKEKRISKIGLLSSLLTSLSFVFVMFLHWPQESSENPLLYVSMYDESTSKLQKTKLDKNQPRARKVK